MLASQTMVLENGQFWNRNLQKVFSVNDGAVKADFNDTRGAITWKIGLKNDQFGKKNGLACLVTFFIGYSLISTIAIQL